MVAFHFPPLVGSVGIHRTLRFVQHLPGLGWDPVVLSAHPRAYERTGNDLSDAVPDGVPVVRAGAFDAARHFAVKGRYPRVAALPDRWISWWPGAVIAGLRAVRRYRPDVLWSTYPIATAHKIGSTLHALTGIPWIADFRDPMISQDYPTDPRVLVSFERIERATMARAARAVYTTPNAVLTAVEKYPSAAGRTVCIENGYDEDSFAGLLAGPAPLNPGRITILHSGTVYPSERDPTALFQALRVLIDQDPSVKEKLRLRFRATGHDAYVMERIAQFRLQDVIELLPGMPHRDALQEMLRADILLTIQASNCNDQIPAKIYEYLRARRPICALVDPVGATAGLLRQAGLQVMAPHDHPDAIVELLRNMLTKPEIGRAENEALIEASSRRQRSRQFAELLDTVRDERMRSMD